MIVLSPEGEVNNLDFALRHRHFPATLGRNSSDPYDRVRNTDP